MNTIGVEGLTKRFQRGREVITAVDNATFVLPAGTLTALVGPSGSGKTTLLNLLVRGDEADAGCVLGVPERSDWTQLALVPQALGLLPELTVGENVGVPQRLGAQRCRPACDMMERLGVGDLVDRAPSQVSLGEQQRVAVARALVTSPAFLVADEPTSHQDDANAHRVISALVELAATGSCVLVATHDGRVLDVCGQLLRIRDGVVSRD